MKDTGLWMQKDKINVLATAVVEDFGFWPPLYQYAHILGRISTVPIMTASE